MPPKWNKKQILLRPIFSKNSQEHAGCAHGKFFIYHFSFIIYMSLFEQVSKGIMEAMKARDAVRRDTLRNVKKYFLEAKTAAGAGEELSDADALKILQKLAKQGRESADIFLQQGRQDLADEELAQVAVIEEFLPRQLTPDELCERLKAIIAAVGATGPQDLGKVMKAATQELSGQADGKAISAAARQLLA